MLVHQRRCIVPWDETSRMDQRHRFVRDFSTYRYTMTELCERYGISRPTGYKWAKRWAKAGPPGLLDRSRAPHSCPHRTPEELVEALLEARRAHPRWGPRKLLYVLEKRSPGLPWPAASTVGELLRRHGLVEPRRRKRRPLKGGRPRLDIQHPNELWTTDFKGQFRVGNGRYCYPLTVADRASRYLLRCQSLESTSHDGVLKHFELAFREFGLPRRLLSDWG